MGFLDHIRACNQADLALFVPFQADGLEIGHIHRAEIHRLEEFHEIFVVDENAVSLASSLKYIEDRSSAIAHVVNGLTTAGVIPHGAPEIYPATTGFGAKPLFEIDRSAVPFFGLRAYGVHVNGFVHGPDDQMSLWIGRRGTDVRICPGMLDNMVAGGQPIGLGLLENVVKEAEEEAGIPIELAQTAISVGNISYVMDTEQGLRPDTMFCFDLELPVGFEPACQDGSVAEYYLWPVERVAEIVETSFEFKFNCNLVIIDFLIRHGFIDKSHPQFAALKAGLGR